MATTCILFGCSSLRRRKQQGYDGGVVLSPRCAFARRKANKSNIVQATDIVYQIAVRLILEAALWPNNRPFGC
jgi:hypothetical protein